MSHELICSWLGLPPDCWPPDHYRLLGLDVGEGDVALIEQRVHQRLDSVRPYQMMHPEQATEAMNRLAQAFVCLTEPAAKLSYDAQLLGMKPKPAPPPLPTPPPAPAPPPLPGPAAEPRDPLVWLYTPGINGPGGVPPPPVRVPPPAEQEGPNAPSAAPPAPQPLDPILEAAQRSDQARRHLATRRALYHRVALTRKLQRLWHKLGRHLQDAEKRLNRQEANELYKLIEQVEEASESFPLLGEAGQPGHLIISLTQLDRSRELRNLDQLQRESLRRDWEAGLRFLEAHRDFLREEIAAARRRGRRERLARAARAWLNEKPAVALLVLGGLLALGIAVWRSVL